MANFDLELSKWKVTLPIISNQNYLNEKKMFSKLLPKTFNNTHNPSKP